MSPRNAPDHGLPFTAPWLLAPMDGVTDPAFRDLVLELHDARDLGGAFTEFVRVTQHPAPAHVIAPHLGTRRFAAPVGLQLMGNDLGAMAASARTAVELGAPLVDVNFGCPARGAFASCAGSGLLNDPAAITAIVRAVADAVPEVPVTAKIRAGIRDDLRLEEIARAAEAGGARLLTVHARTRSEGYRDDAIDWRRIARAVATVSIPVCGNGGVARHEQLEEMRRATGCAFVMVGRGAMGDPWVFSGHRPDAAEAARFLVRYADAVAENGTPARAAGRLKQLFRYWTPGGFVHGDRDAWLREEDPQRLIDRLRAIAGA